MESHPTEYKALSFKHQVNKNSKLFSFAPYNNEKKILCVGGRINAANLPKESKNRFKITSLIQSHNYGHSPT